MGWSFEVHNRQKAQRMVTRPEPAADRSGRYRHDHWERAAGANALLSAVAVLTAVWMSNGMRKHRHKGRIDSFERKLFKDLRHSIDTQLASLGSFKSTIVRTCRRGFESAGRLRRKNSQHNVSTDDLNSKDSAALSECCMNLPDREAAAVLPTARNGESISSTALSGANLSRSATFASEASSKPSGSQTAHSSRNQARYLDITTEECSPDPPVVSRPSKSSTKRNKRKGRKGKH